MKTRKTKEEKMEILKSTDKYDLIKLYCQHITHFNPLDEDTCETYELITKEILSRMTDVV